MCSEISTLENEFKTLWIRKPDSPDTEGRKLYPERKSCGLKNIQIRVDEALLTNIFENVTSLKMAAFFLTYLDAYNLPLAHFLVFYLSRVLQSRTKKLKAVLMQNVGGRGNQGVVGEMYNWRIGITLTVNHCSTLFARENGQHCCI